DEQVPQVLAVVSLATDVLVQQASHDSGTEIRALYRPRREEKILRHFAELVPEPAGDRGAEPHLGSVKDRIRHVTAQGSLEDPFFLTARQLECGREACHVLPQYVVEEG